MNKVIPSEHQEALILANWLRFNFYNFYKSPSETWTKSWSQKRKNKMEWVTKGFPDYTIILKRNSLLFIELKKVKGKKGGLNWSKISLEQKEWIQDLQNIDNIEAKVCHWAQEAIDFIIECEQK